MATPDYDLIIIGAGPAGMAAAAESARQGLRCALLDEQEEAGGQIYRAIGRAPWRTRRSSARTTITAAACSRPSSRPAWTTGRAPPSGASRRT